MWRTKHFSLRAYGIFCCTEYYRLIIVRLSRQYQHAVTSSEKDGEADNVVLNVVLVDAALFGRRWVVLKLITHTLYSYINFTHGTLDSTQHSRFDTTLTSAHPTVLHDNGINIWKLTLSIHTRGSRPCSSINIPRHTCSLSYLQLGSSLQL